MERNEGRKVARRKEKGRRENLVFSPIYVHYIEIAFYFLTVDPLKLLLVLQGILILLLIKTMNSTYFLLFKRASNTCSRRIKHIKSDEAVIRADYPEVGNYSSKDRLFPCYYLPS